MRDTTLAIVIALCLSLPVSAAERMQRLGDLEVHYSAFNASHLQPQIAQASGLVRNGQQGVLNVSVLRAGKSSPARVSGEVKSVLGHGQTLTFIEQREGEFVSYLAQFPITSREVLLFNLQVNGQRLDFNQELFPEP
ncbi:DUF4426 domain-containing protein [Pseudomonas daroniae]|uniref:DUF4426 domain-containing protein n=1 Tax=Phytopseudomonas daroniae TaxID=2487519 RepID=A0A4Q9QN10_9GAMM|nr:MULTISPECIES: DUF4426 domain-containing protein [Pseudomonas]TBU80220.1 DUF4426 domain-containing protein [Pseudomonas daroniae]TBU85350.1 DUF4426 domain-containing protein [Pseudomonas sp. FRB 228]TBU94197.1 DUF4426 domain-containing protein [Pseudomonas daroniae]